MPATTWSGRTEVIDQSAVSARPMGDGLSTLLAACGRWGESAVDPQGAALGTNVTIHR